MLFLRAAAACFLISLCIIPPATAQTDVTSRATVFAGPYAATVVRVIDGDTLQVNVALWPGLRAEYAVRVRDIGAPELFRPDCEKELDNAIAAKAQVEKLYPTGLDVQLRQVSYDAFSGRVVADVRRWVSDRWLPLSKELLDRQLAVEWSPHQSAFNWCLD
ncbi:thermonuclease family protein [Pseudotabrizicola sediminis]|uniref:Thermonuclease family protein n=1 Tax=Pseudotabrizicola sediminis TaxID=2486418 RepID=A0ABY2KN98_9RHOB|nr:thermonuclease family protein [Pseudotabrizicola sediminis]TGD44141.1 thermonuclease family protein [Pseudotabrizicola sediminis]